MDWSRAKTILIVSFLFLNVILGYQLWNSKSKQTVLAADEEAIIADTRKLLESKNIKLAKEFPTTLPDLKVITVKFDDSTQMNAKQPLSKPEKFNGFINKLTPRLSTFPSGIKNPEMYQYDPVTSKAGSVYVLYQMYGKVPIFDVKLQLYEENGEITAFRQAYVEVESEEDKKEQKIIPSYMAIRSLVENYLNNNVEIKDVSLGYHGLLFNSQTQFMVPYWRVAISNGDVYYIHAYNGALEPPQSGQDTNPFTTDSAKK
jgi:regulatory protein YycI of two-component signal transduction system YycFG